MTADIYADEMFLINFMANIFIIEMSKRLLKLKISLLRESGTAAVFAGLYTVFVISEFRAYFNIITMLIFNTAEIMILFKPDGFKSCAKYGIVFKFASLCTNGCMLVISNYMKEKFNYFVLISGFALTYLSYVFIELLNKKITYYSIDIKWRDKTININALVDTGNSLIEPLSNKPVIVAEYSVLKDVLPQKLVEIYENKRESNLMEIVSAISEDNLRKNMRVIPFKSVGNEKGMMIGFIAESVKIKDNIIKKPVIGICRFNLSRNGLYSALISPKHLGGI